jgi:hypothetical protein
MGTVHTRRRPIGMAIEVSRSPDSSCLLGKAIELAPNNPKIVENEILKKHL